MTPRFRRVVVFVGTAALATGAGIGVAAQGDGSTSRNSTAAPGINRPEGPGRGFDVSALADKLGVSQSRLDQAMQKSRQTRPGRRGGTDARIQALADQLDLSPDTVRAALDSVFGAGGGQPPAAPATPPASSQNTTRS